MDGTSHGLTAYRDFDDMMRGADSVFKDCEIGKVWDENGTCSSTATTMTAEWMSSCASSPMRERRRSTPSRTHGSARSSPSPVRTYDGSANSTIDALDDLWRTRPSAPPRTTWSWPSDAPAEEWGGNRLSTPLLAIAEFTPSAIHERRGRLGRRECDRARYIRPPPTPVP